ncbi:MAG: GAF domain-containing sensor histidine kinase [Anaerolineae bacterium]|nr:GAF domain-containing sensor histidine kinase [Anaerolineae bacterium]
MESAGEIALGRRMLKPKIEPEIEILVQLASDLTQAATPQDWLDAVSDYARARGAVAGFLLWMLSGPDAPTIEAEIAASWTRDDKPHLTSGDRLVLPTFWNQTTGWLGEPDEPMLIENTRTSPLLDDFMRDYYSRIDVGAVALLPQLVQGRWVSLLGFHWREPQQFDEPFRRICEIVIRRAGPAINSIRLLEQNRERASRAETLSEVNTALSQAHSEDDILAAMLTCARAFADPFKISLIYVNLDANGQPIEAFNVASCGPLVYMAEQNKVYELDDTPFQMIASLNSEVPVFAEDMVNDARFNEQDREIARTIGNRSAVMLPLRSADTWQGVMLIVWDQPRTFSEQERFVYTRLLPTLASVVASRRAYLETQASQNEASTLYHLAERINAAMTYQDVADAVVTMLKTAAGVYLDLWENHNYEGATYMEIAAAANVPDPYRALIGQHLPKANFPIIEAWRNRRLTVVEDVETDERIDPQSRENLIKLGMRTFLSVAFNREDKLAGAIFFSYPEPRKFGQRERRLALGIGDLVHGAVQRIHSQLETGALAEAQRVAYLAEQEAREEAESLYRVSEEINAATTYHDIVRAVAKLDFGPGDIYLNIFENFNFEGARYFDIVATATDMFDHEGERWWIDNYPLVQRFPKQGVFVNEDIANNPNIDPTSKQMFLRLGVHSNMRVSLSLHNRWIGGLGIDSPIARSYGEREKRLMAGVGDLVVAAIERIRLQEETAAAAEAQRQAFLAEQEAREEREILFRASQAINAANSFPEILSAVSHIDFDGDFYLSIYENFNSQNATYIESVSTTKGAFIKERRRFDMDEVPYYIQHAEPGLAVIEDMTRDPDIDSITRETLISHGIMSGMRFGLIWNGRHLGAFGLDNAQPRLYSERERRQMTALGELVSAAVERIRLQQETIAAAEAQRQAFLAEQETREETTALYQVSKAINQATEMSEVLHAAKQLFPDPVDVAIFAWENYDRSQATYLETIAASDAHLQPGLRLPREIVSWPALLDPTQLLVANDVNGPEWANHRAADSARLFGLHSIAYTNLMHSQRVQGLFALGCYEPYSFTPKEIRLMAAIADLTAAAMERFRSRQAEQEAREEREILFRASQAINAANSFPEILSAVNLIDFDGGDCYMYIFENYDFKTATYIETVATGSDMFMHKGMRVPMADVPFLKTHPRPGLWAYEDIANHPELDPTTKATMLSHGVASNLRYGLVRKNRILGAFGVDHGTPKIYTAREKRVMAALGDLVSAAAERIRLQQETHAARERAERLAEQAQQLAALEERTRLARELHDSVSQALYGIGLGAQTARAMWEKDQTLVKESVDYVLALAEAALVEMRALIFELRPESLENEGLITALAKQGASLQARHGLDMRLELCDEPPLGLDTKEGLYRIAREALHNVVKHAGATQVILRLRRLGDTLVLEVIDNGAGFETDRDFPGHLGLQSMRERVEQLGGEINIESAVGKGTHITVSMCLLEDESSPSKGSNTTIGMEDE